MVRAGENSPARFCYNPNMKLQRFLFLVAIAVVLAAGLRHFIFEGVYIASASIEPTLPVGRHLFLDKTTYIFRDPRRGDVISLAGEAVGYGLPRRKRRGREAEVGKTAGRRRCGRNGRCWSCRGASASGNEKGEPNERDDEAAREHS